MTNEGENKTKGRRPDDPHMAEKDTIDKLIPVDDSPQRDPEEVAEEMRQQIAAGPEGKMPVVEEEEEEAGVVTDGVVTGNTPPEVAPPAPATVDSATARAIAVLQQEVADTRAELARVTAVTAGDSQVKGDTDSSFPWQLYRKPDEHTPGEANEAGWIVVAPGGATSTGRRNVGAFAKYMVKGMKPLTRYPPVATPTRGKPGKEFIPMLEAGGAREFPVSQILAYKWHQKPPIPGLVFPQIATAEEAKQIRSFRCEECSLELWFVKGDDYTLRACFTHLTRPESKGGVHGYRREEAARALSAQGLPAVGRMAIEAEEERLEELATPSAVLDTEVEEQVE